MTDENTAHYWERVREIYERVLGIAVPEREAALHASCEGDVDLQRDVEYLIRAFENNPDFLETPLDLPSPAPSFEPRAAIGGLSPSPPTGEWGHGGGLSGGTG